jgi:Uma2 family endonuclease
MSTTTSTPTGPAREPAKIPPLQNGDRLTRAEFERRYEAMPEVKKAELIEGVVYKHSPVCHVDHGHPHFHVLAWLGQYAAFTSGVEGGDNSSLRLDLNNEPQPDAFLMLLPTHGGQSSIDEDDYVAGAPELIAEVAASSVSYDLGVKLNAYCRNGVREYVVWRVLDAEVDWFVLRGGAYERQSPDAAGVYRSEVFPGLWLDTMALMRGDLATVFRTLQEGLASPKHSAFVSKIAAAARGSGKQ